MLLLREILHFWPNIARKDEHLVFIGHLFLCFLPIIKQALKEYEKPVPQS